MLFHLLSKFEFLDLEKKEQSESQAQGLCQPWLPTGLFCLGLRSLLGSSRERLWQGRLAGQSRREAHGEPLGLLDLRPPCPSLVSFTHLSRDGEGIVCDKHDVSGNLEVGDLQREIKREAG